MKELVAIGISVAVKKGATEHEVLEALEAAWKLAAAERWPRLGWHWKS